MRRARLIELSRPLATTSATRSTKAAPATTDQAISTDNSAEMLIGYQPVAVDTRASRSNPARTMATLCSTRTVRTRSAPCSAAAKATSAAALNPVATVQAMMARALSPDSAETRAPAMAPPIRLTISAIRSRLRRKRDLSTGASNSQNPSAADARTGPKIRETARAKPMTAVTTASGRTFRAA